MASLVPRCLRGGRARRGGVLRLLVAHPVLLPRDPAFQGLVSGIAAAIGYGLGLLARRVGRRVISWRPGGTTRRVARVALASGGPVLLAVFAAAGWRWQREIHRLVGERQPGGASPIVIVLITVVLFVGLVATARLLRRLVQVLARPLSRRLLATIASVVAVAVVALASGIVLNRLVLQIVLSGIDRAFSVTNRGTTPGIERPTSPLRSGAPSSLSSWVDLGMQGRDFVAGGPTTDELAGFAGRPVLEPIRVYVGLETAASSRDRAATAVAELERTGAFDRAVLCVVTTTGTGWVDQTAAEALEYLHAGDTAIVATQYSYLPSWVSFLVDRTRAEEEGRAVFAAVHARWSELPPDARPRLLVYGESLGSNGSQAAFDGLGDVRNRADGALWVGPLNSNELWREIVDRRDRGPSSGCPSTTLG